MKKIIVLLVLTATVVAILSFSDEMKADPIMAYNDSLTRDRAKYTQAVREMIKGREKTTVDSVFKNLTHIGGFEAEILPEVMLRWSEALGVSCGHCHENNKWELDIKPEKEIARQMSDLSSMINTQLKQIKGIKSTRPVINCASCHQGKLKPPLRVQ